jgi:tripartite-type tricarboxylate transporter receptor subunit TctC
MPRSVRIIVPQAAGGAADTIARLLAEQVSASQGLSIVVENRAGAGGIIASEAVARAEPNDNMLLINSPDMLISPHLRALSYDGITSFAPVCLLVRSPGILVVNSSSPVHTLADFIDAARSRPAEMTVAGAGAATAKHVGVQMLGRAANADLTYVPYTGGAPAINALLGEHVASVYTEYAPLASHLKAGALRALATTSRSRIPQMPELPTVAESGYPDFDVDLWWGIFAPARTPETTVRKLAEWFTVALQAPAVKTRLDALGFSYVGDCGPSFAALLQKQSTEYRRVVRETRLVDK